MKTLSKLITIALICAMSVCLLACSAGGDSSKTEDTTFTLAYPKHMQEMGYTEPIVLDSTPERIVSLSTYPALALFELGVDPVALPSTQVVEYPSDWDGTLLPSMMSDNFDVETVVDLEPDLVIMPASVQEMYGATFDELEIPVYYMAMTAEGYSAYDVIKEQTQELVNAFDPSSDLMSKFDTVDQELADFASVTEGKSVLALTVSGDTCYICSTGGTLGSMLEMCGLTNVYENDTVSGHGMIEMDMETAINYTPDIVVITGSGTAADNETTFKAIIDSNPEYWNTFEAVKDNKIIYLPSSYVSTAGLNIITNLENLMDDLRTALN